VAAGGVPSARSGDGGFLKAQLLFDPGTKWEYGISRDWLGKLVEKISGHSLEGVSRADRQPGNQIELAGIALSG
jgi:hypothetical protein